ncbi:transcription elongation factor [Aspergillus coremiiformis]|uniref:Transcription elongation factor 1 homolog n=1 Tax=Aspergillus coremiiformis TaxID=138285 RepID=A0A5N6YUX9_9EURO|nr:transcription elongation factor [Aspergillus coremiiformis]
MGKRKKSSRQPQGPKKREPLPTTFACLFCNHENSVVVKLDKKLGLGNLSCKVCGQRFQTGINYLSAAVDVYSDWVDACDAVAKDTANRYEDINARGLRSNEYPVAASGQDLEEDDAGHVDAYADNY